MTLVTEARVFAQLSSEAKPTAAGLGSLLEEIDTGLQYRWDGAQWNLSGGKRIAGDYYSVILSAVQTGDPTGSAQIWTDATGCRGFRLQSLGVLTAGNVIVTGWSTNAAATLDRALLDDVLTAGTVAPDVVVVPYAAAEAIEVSWDGLNTIKRIASITNDSAARSILLTVWK